MASEFDGDPRLPRLTTLLSSPDTGINGPPAPTPPISATRLLPPRTPMDRGANRTPAYADQEAQVDLTLTHVDQGVQAGEPWAEVLSKETYNEVLTDDRRFDRILLRIKRGGWSIGRFLEKLFTIPKQTELSRSRRHAAVVSSFLGGSGGPGGKYETVKPDTVVELMYSSRDSTPKATRQTPGQTAEKEDHDPSGMARALLSEWAIRKVEGYVSTSAAEISSKDGGFHLRKEQTTWEFIHGFSLAKAILSIELKAGVLLRILAAAALPPLLSEKLRPSVANPSPGQPSSHSRDVLEICPKFDSPLIRGVDFIYSELSEARADVLVGNEALVLRALQRLGADEDKSVHARLRFSPKFTLRKRKCSGGERVRVDCYRADVLLEHTGHLKTC
ncbi:hypothetical protein C8R47DRAFT_1150181 [Mycena vitilis]|nr:hypothetical protein C8R47DRAFT_1150181 [Mycena vitilis]